VVSGSQQLHVRGGHPAPAHVARIRAVARAVVRLGNELEAQAVCPATPGGACVATPHFDVCKVAHAEPV